MKSGKLFYTGVFFLLFSLCPGNLNAADHVSFISRIDWENNTLGIEAKTDLLRTDSFIPVARQESEHKIEQHLPVAFRDSLSHLIIDSSHTAGELAADSPELIRAINELTYKHTRTFSHISEDLHFFSLEYTYKFYPDIVSMFIKHESPYKPPRILAYVPTTDFSGIVIYMKGKFPVHGERKDTELVPCLFPRIFDRNMNMIYEKGMVDPDVLEKWGMAAYTPQIDEKKYTQRIGETPLRILGEGVFGENYTDIIISTERADQILFTDHNRQLLEQGRVLIICDLPGADRSGTD